MENKQEYKENRFGFSIFVNDNLICKRNFKIPAFIEGSMNTADFKETVDDVVRMVDDELKMKSILYTSFYYNPRDVTEEFTEPLSDPWTYTFKIVFSDGKRPVITRIWDGRAYPKAIRDKVDLVNKYVRVTSKDGQTFVYPKEEFFNNNTRLSFDQEVKKAMIMGRPDVLTKIMDMVCELCSQEEGSNQKNPLEDFYESDIYRISEGSKEYKKYSFNVHAKNVEYIKDLEKKYRKKTKEYFDTLYVK